jgi:hypothetical protein
MVPSSDLFRKFMRKVPKPPMLHMTVMRAKF